MRVGVERQRNLAVAERLHDDSRVHSLCKQQRRCRVAEIVDTNSGQLRPRKHRFEHSPDVSFIHRRADGGCKNESPRPTWNRQVGALPAGVLAGASTLRRRNSGAPRPVCCVRCWVQRSATSSRLAGAPDAHEEFHVQDPRHSLVPSRCVAHNSLSANHIVQAGVCCEVSAGRIKADDCLPDHTNSPTRGVKHHDARAITLAHYLFICDAKRCTLRISAV
jgi:hypothetical protein